MSRAPPRLTIDLRTSLHFPSLHFIAFGTTIWATLSTANFSAIDNSHSTTNRTAKWTAFSTTNDSAIYATIGSADRTANNATYCESHKAANGTTVHTTNYTK